MQAESTKGYGIEIDRDGTGYVVRLIQDGQECHREEAVKTFAGVYKHTLRMMTVCRVGMEAVSIPYKLIAGVPQDDGWGRTFANYCLDHACVKEPDALV